MFANTLVTVRLIAAAALVALTSAAVSPVTAQTKDTKPAAPVRTGNGVMGKVDRGPVRPHERPGLPNNVAMAKATIIVQNLNGTEVARTTTDKDGWYELRLKPGKYKLVGPRYPMPHRGNWTKEIEIKNNQWNQVDIHIDTGIR